MAYRDLRDFVAKLEKEGDGRLIYSLANVLRLRRPVVIMDEAHNARTPLSFETLIRFNPSCVIEFTATPQTVHNPDRGEFASNVLHHVSARELKAEEMLKLPVKLLTNPDWKEVVGAALAKQRELEETATKQQQQTGEYLRPIVLFQAQPQNKNRPTLTVEVLKKALIDDFRIPEDQIAIATGQTRELDDVDVMSPTCPIRFIITVQALREGWDCPFAYILCSVAEQSSPRAVEQILGRIMRMPQARRKVQADLNVAYAFVTSNNFASTAASLRDALVENGFQHLEAQDLIVPVQQTIPFGDGGLFAAASAVVTETPDLIALDENLRPNVSFDPATKTLKVQGAIGAADVKALKSCFREKGNRAAIDAIRDQLTGRSTQAAIANDFSLTIPLLAVRVGQQLELFDDGFFLDAPWNLAECDATLSDAEFSINQSTGTSGELDVTAAGRVEMVGFVQQLQQQLSLFGREPNWTVAALANWLDRNIPHQDIPQAQSSLYLHNAITKLLEARGVSLDQLARLKYRLRDALEHKVALHRQANRQAGYQAALFGNDSLQLDVDPSISVTINDDRYAPNWYYEGNFRFAKHAFKHIGEMKDDGEEFECATVIDSLASVKIWVRNLSRGDSSFWLQTATDRFYPDFVARLNDGRWLVIEYKNDRDWSNDDSKEKRAVGELWANRSKGRCLFSMPKGKQWDAIRALAT